MASSSTSSIHKTCFKYDVFLSFRGEDTRTNFVDHLYHALKRQNIETYKDDKNLEKGKKITKELIEAIEDSRFHVVVFSKNYASSCWCLDELVKIMECQKMQTEQTVYPIFFDVEPTEVRNQNGAFGDAFAKHKNKEDVGKWRKALEDATYFTGWDLRTTGDGHEVDFIKLVVKDISLKLPAVSAEENLVGMKTRINGVVSSLNAFPDELCMIGIWGMGGSGKTTLARVVFDQISFQFEGISFVANVREISKPDSSGLKKLQQQVLRDVSNDQGITINNVFDGKNMMRKKMSGKKVLVVLDDVDHINQLKALAGEPNWFKPGSKIIITTRDKQVLLAHKVNSIHDVNLLTHDEAICLLSRCAFGTEIPIPGYEELSRKVVSYAAGLPLTITILGSSLCDENEHVWIDTLKELEKIPLDGTLQKLELSYVGLDNNCKEIFLDVACILKGWEEEVAIRVLESRGFHAIRGLSVLEKKSLITISTHGCLEMHDHIQEMGRYIVRRLHPDEPNKHSRLWIHKEIEDILANDRGTEATCVDLFVSETNLETVMKGLAKMEKLRLLYVNIHDILCNWKVDEVSQYFPNSLQYVNWWSYPFCSLPKTFPASNLVGLEMLFSRMEQLWEGGERKVLHKLRFLRLRGSKLRTFDLGLTPNLEILDLEYCRDLVELHMPVGCPKLKSLKLGSSKLRTLDVRLVPNIETLDLDGCQDLVKLDMPHEFSQLKSLNLRCPHLMSLNLGPTPNIKTFKLEECDYLVELDMSLECPQLESLYLRISKLRTLNLGRTLNLETLVLQGCYNLVQLRLHNECCKLKTLNLECPMLRTFDLGLTLNLEALTLNGSTDDLAKLLFFVRCPELKYLRLINSNLRTLELTLNLKTLILEGCYLVELHIPNGDVKLESVDIKSCWELKTLELTLNLKTLILASSGLVELHFRDGDVKIESIDIDKCSELKTLDLGRTPNLMSLRLNRCSSLVKVHAPVGGLKKLIKLEANLDGRLVNICPLHPDNKEDLPSSLENIEKLTAEGFSCACVDLESFFRSICGFQHITKLTLGGSIPKAPKDLDRLQCLEVLILKWTNIKHLPDSICTLKHLKSLHLFNCKLLEKLPEDLDRLESLETLMLEWCIVLRDIPNSICRMKSLKYFSLYCCNTLKELPEELGRLECLKELNIEGTCINHLPRGILLLDGLQIHWSEHKRRICCTML